MIKKIKSIFGNNSVSQQNRNYNTLNLLYNNKNNDLIDNAVWQSNPYLYYNGTTSTIINQISNFISTLDYFIKDKKDNIITNNSIQPIIDLLQKPSKRNTTYQQFIFDITQEYTFNRLIYLCFDLENQELFCIKNYEVMPEYNYTNDKMFKSYRVYITNIKQEIFTLNNDGYYENENKTKLLFPSELIFEEISNNYGNIKYCKHIFNEIWNNVYLENLILQKNLTLSASKQDANLLIINSKESMSLEQEDNFIKSIQNATQNAYNNGKTGISFANGDINANLLKLNDNNFNFQFKEAYESAKRNIYNYFQIPPEMQIEQAKFTNNITSNISFIDYCISPRSLYIFSFLSNVINIIFNQDITIEINQNSSTIKKQYNANLSNNIKEALTINEYRELIGYEKLPFGGDELMKNNKQNNLSNENNIF